MPVPNDDVTSIVTRNKLFGVHAPDVTHAMCVPDKCCSVNQLKLLLVKEVGIALETFANLRHTKSIEHLSSKGNAALL